MKIKMIISTLPESQARDQVPTCEAHRQLTGIAACLTAHTDQGRVTKVTRHKLSTRESTAAPYITFSVLKP